MARRPRPDAQAQAADDRAELMDVLPPQARRAIAVTRLGLWWERLASSFWLAGTLAIVALAALWLGLVAELPSVALLWVAGLWLLALLAALLVGWRRFRAPSFADAVQRVDRRLTGRPLDALGDRMVLGGPGSDALWQAHLAQAHAAAATAAPVAPDAGLVTRDPYALRLIGLTALAMALLFGGAGPAGQGLAALAAGWRPAAVPAEPKVAAGPSWEGWAAPPLYTRRPTIYLNALKDDELTVPEGTALTFRLYGEGAQVEQDIGPPAKDSAPPTAQDAEAVTALEFQAVKDGTVRVGGRAFTVTVIPDAEPVVQLAALAARRADGRFAQGFTASDDNGIVSGQARIELDLAAVDRRYGLAVAPEQREALTLDLPLPGAGQRRQVKGTLAAELAKHPWANLPVTLTLSVRDGIEQVSSTPPTAMVLPGRRFFDPLAAGLIEMRRDLLWSRDNAAHSARLLRAMVWQSERPVPDDAAKAIIAAVKTLETGSLAADGRDGLAESLWTAAVAIEDGGLSDALARMQQAQERLSEAIRNGASPDEIQRLMDELKAATDAYMDMLAQQGEDPAAKFDRSEQNPQTITGDQIQQMMDEIQRLMNEGRMAEAAELLDQFNRMMENMQVRDGEGQGQGRGSRSQQRLTETLREQQRLADDAMREAQGQPFSDGQQPGQRPDQGQGQGQEQGQEQGQGQGLGEPGAEGEGGVDGSLADRQRGLREDLGRQRGLLPGRGTPEGDAAGRQLDEAGQAMEDAEQALRDGDAAGAMQRQADAIQAMREGIRALGDLNARQQGQSGQPGDQGEGQNGQDGQQGESRGEGEGFAEGETNRDPLGRTTSGQGGNISTGEALAEGERQAGRARELQDEIRRRSGERDRPTGERDYLGRLLDQF